MSLLHKTQTPTSGGGNSAPCDLLSPLVSTEVYIGGATALSNAAFGKMHNISSGPVTLPPPSGNAGKWIGLRFTSPAGILPNGGELISGRASKKVYAAGDFALLLCDGANWTSMETLKLIAFKAILSADQSGIPSYTFLTAQYANKIYDIGNCYDTTNYKFTPNTPGHYMVSLNMRVQHISVGAAAWAGAQLFAADETPIGDFITISTVSATTDGSFIDCIGSKAISIPEGASMQFQIYHNCNDAQTLVGGSNTTTVSAVRINGEVTA